MPKSKINKAPHPKQTQAHTFRRKQRGPHPEQQHAHSQLTFLQTTLRCTQDMNTHAGAHVHCECKDPSEKPCLALLLPSPGQSCKSTHCHRGCATRQGFYYCHHHVCLHFHESRGASTFSMQKALCVCPLGFIIHHISKAQPTLKRTASDMTEFLTRLSALGQKQYS